MLSILYSISRIFVLLNISNGIWLSHRIIPIDLTYILFPICYLHLTYLIFPKDYVYLIYYFPVPTLWYLLLIIVLLFNCLSCVLCAQCCLDCLFSIVPSVFSKVYFELR